MAGGTRITDQRKEPTPHSLNRGDDGCERRRVTSLFLWLVGLICGGVLIVALHGAS
jgi:hypothetical protein